MLQEILIFQQLVLAFYIIILTVQQSYFSDLYLAKSFFLCNSAIIAFNIFETALRDFSAMLPFFGKAFLYNRNEL